MNGLEYFLEKTEEYMKSKDAVSMSVIENIKAELQAKCDSIPWRNTYYDDGWIEALEWALEVIDKYIGKESE